MKDAEKEREEVETRGERDNLQYREELEHLRGLKREDVGAVLFLIKAEICLVSRVATFRKKKKMLSEI